MIDKMLPNINRPTRVNLGTSSQGKAVNKGDIEKSESGSGSESDVKISDIVHSVVHRLVSEPAPDNVDRIAQLQNQLGSKGYEFDADTLANNLMDEYFK